MTTQTTFTLKNDNELIVNSSIDKTIMDCDIHTDDFFFNKIFSQSNDKKNKEVEQRQVSIVMDDCFDSAEAYYFATERCEADLKRHKEYANGSIAVIIRKKYDDKDVSDNKMKTILKVCRDEKYCNYYDDSVRDPTEVNEDDEYEDFEGPRMATDLSDDDDKDEYNYLPEQDDIFDEDGDEIFDDNDIDMDDEQMELDNLKTMIEKIVKNNKIKQEKFKQHPKRISHPIANISMSGILIDNFDECQKYFEDLFLNGNGLFSSICFISKSGEFHFRTVYKKPIVVEKEEKIIKRRKTE